MVKLFTLLIILNISMIFPFGLLKASNFEYHGYYRAGVGTNSKGGDQICFNVPGSPSNQFRLGNECSHYGELSFVMKHLDHQNKKGFFDSKLNLAFNQQGHTDWESANSQDMPIVIREVYIRGGHFNNSNLVYWAGKRFLRENDLYMNDWYYFASTNGNGAGVEGVKVFGGNLLASYLKQTLDEETNIGKVAITHYDFRVLDIPLTNNNFLNLWMNYATMPKSTSLKGQTYDAQNGLALGVLLNNRFSSGFNHLSLSYGKALMSGLTLGGSTLSLKNSNDLKLRKDAYTFRLVEHFSKEFTKSFKLMLMAAYEYKKPNSQSETTRTNFINIGVSPTYYFDDHYHITAVIGHSVYKAKNQKDQNFTRLTIAPGIAINRSVWGRPIIRLFYTKSFWSDSAMGKIGGDTYRTSTHASNFGIQGETWF